MFGSVTVDLVIGCEQLPKPGVTVIAPGYEMLPGKATTAATTSVLIR